MDICQTLKLNGPLLRQIDATFQVNRCLPLTMQNNSIELCNCSFDIQHQVNLTTLICN